MKLSDKTARVMELLDERFPSPPVPLDHDDPFTLLIAVLLSAQCTDIKVNQITPKLFARARTPHEMVDVPVDEIRQIIRPCGLSPQKAKAISGLSRILLDKHDGQVPDSLEELELLPGVGHKTASVVMAHAFGHAMFPVDTHIHRCAWRWGLSNGSSVERTERDLKRAFPEERWNDLHLQIIWFGRTECPAQRHDPEQCPICSWAMSKARRTQEARKRKRKS